MILFTEANFKVLTIDTGTTTHPEGKEPMNPKKAMTLEALKTWAQHFDFETALKDRIKKLESELAVAKSDLENVGRKLAEFSDKVWVEIKKEI